ncbi:tetratricopeptide repeat protein [Argonema antarcticum]|uniref:tetratricopeptide repeat protein n=1 Tax=Argonema antarcticum TaxID=2942763 RepID=UPI0020138F3E|nr:tetratricopeptide repeat protein [Argonema antarcticum]MCL1474311.1 tetratricopeptide repeat protein [Argonema antarcticum A004/B2]
MNQQKRIRRSYVLSENGWNKFQDALEEKFEGKCSNERLAGLSKLSTDTVSEIRRRKKRVDESSIEALFRALGLKLEENDLSVTVRVSPPQEDPNFVGREGAIADLNRLIQQGAKAIVIYGKGGIGKTTLAWQFLNTQGFDKILDLRMAKETQNITSAESVIEEWLRRYFDEEPGREFGVTLDRLRQHLRNPNQRIGVLIDNLEPALDGNGRCIEAQRKYVDLFTALADPSVQSVTLITSRECLHEPAVTVEHYSLEGLDVAAWEKFFNSRNIQIDTEVLSAMHQAYGGNAKAMEIFLGAIKEFNNSLAAYWQANKDDLLIEPDLEHLVTSQFDRLQKLHSSAYKLLCRLGCYRYQDVPRVPIEGLLCLLWDVQDNQHRRVIKSLQDRSLVDFCNGEYWLHPVIRAEAIKRLRESEDWEIANRKAAEFWTESVKTVETVEDAVRACEAYNQYLQIDDFEQAGIIIVKEINSTLDNVSSSLGASFYRLGLSQQISIRINTILDKVTSEYCLSRLYNIIGNNYAIMGNLKKGIEFNRISGQIAKKLGNEKQHLVSLLNIGHCQIYLWELDKGLEFFDQLILISQPTNYNHFYLGHSLPYIAFIKSCLGYKEEALVIAEEAGVKIFRDDTSKYEQGYGLIYLGLAYKNLGKREKSFEMYHKALVYAEASHYTQVKAKAKYGLAELYREQEDFTTALSHHTESIELLEKIGAKCDLAEAYYQLALTYQKMGDTEKSQPKFQEAIRLFNEMEAPKQVEKVQRAMENGENH